MIDCTVVPRGPHGPDASVATLQRQPISAAESNLALALIANRHEWSARSLESILVPDGYVVLRADSGHRALEQARSVKPDVILLDASLADLPATEVCRRLRSDCLISATTPILITLNGPATREHRLAGLRAGAWECLGLPLDAAELLLKLQSFVKAKLAADAAREESLLDEMTGLYNVRGLLRRARELGAAALRHRQALTCVVFAPEIATEEEAAQGIEEARIAAAVRLARVFKTAVRESDAVGRLGQTEFVVMAPDTDAAGALRLAQRLVQAVEVGETEEGHPHRLHIRAGCYSVSNFYEAALEPVEMLVRATMALRGTENGDGEERIRFFGVPPRPATEK